MSIRRIRSRETAVEVGVAQVKWLWQQRQAAMRREFHLVTADGKYGNHRFLGPLRTLPCGKLVRLRRARVLYGDPGPYGGTGRPRVHGDRFAFKEPESWPEATESVEFEDPRWGQVRLRRWDNLHAKQDAQTVFSVILAETHRERAKPPQPFWLGFQYPPTATPAEPPLKELWAGYHYRWPVEVYFNVLKSGCWVEDCRLGDAERLKRFITLPRVIAWRLYWLIHINRHMPDAPCTLVLAEHEWYTLYAKIQRIATFPTQPPTVRQAVHWIARLGGFLDRRRDGEPGIITIWRGWQRLQDMADIWRVPRNDTYG